MKEAIRNTGLAAVISIGLLATLPIIAQAAPVPPVGISIGSRSPAGVTAEKARSAAEQYVNGLAGQGMILNVGGQDVEATAGEPSFHWNNADAVDQAASQYVGGSLIRQCMVQEDLTPALVDLGLDAEVDSAKVKELVDTRCQAVTVQPQDATVTRENGQFIITDSVAGKVVDAAATEAALNRAPEGGLEEPVKMTAEVTEQQSAIITKALTAIQDVLGTYIADFSSSDIARSTNLTVGAAKVNDHLLIPGEVLSGYECLQPFTIANSYKTATVYESDQVVDSIGEDVCQLAATLHSTSLEAEMEIVQKQNHSMIMTYVKSPRDAAITGTYKDIKIKNNYSTLIYVEGYTEGRKLIFTIYGKETRPENHKVEYVSETLGSTSPEEPRLIVDNALAPGAKVKVQSPYTELRSRLWKTVTVDGVEQRGTLLNRDTYNASKTTYRISPALLADVPPDPNAITPVETAPVETTPMTGVDGEPGVTRPAPTEAAPDPAPTNPAPVQADPTPTEAAPGPTSVMTPVSEAAG